MDLDLDAHLTTAEAAVADAVDLDALAVVATELLGRKSVLATVRSRLADMDPDDRKVVGRRVNEIRTEVERLISERRAELAVGARAEVLEAERLDLTEFDRGRRLGHRHVVTQTWERLEDLFVGMGYTVAEGPEIEDEWHNFGALNFQIEGLVVDRDITFGDLAGTRDAFTTAYFGSEFISRLRPSYFPFTEPSAEFDIRRPDGSWLELAGCGMVHPEVLRSCGLDPEEWSGFAFGFGLDRLALMRHGIDDLRELFRNDHRFLGQF